MEGNLKANIAMQCEIILTAIWPNGNILQYMAIYLKCAPKSPPRFGITALTAAIDKGLNLLRDPARGGVAAVGVSRHRHWHQLYEKDDSQQFVRR